MAKKRIYEIAKEVGVDNKVVVQKAKDLGLDVKNHMSSVDDSQVAKLKNSFQNSAPAAKSSNKKNKIKISVSSIRKNEKKQEDNNSSKNSKRRNNKRRSNNHGHENKNDRRNNTGKPKAAALLQQFKQKQRAEEGQLNREAQKARKEYHEQLRHPKQEQPVKDNKKTSNHKDNKKKAEPVEKKVIGPKILKPSPARLKKQQPEATKELVQVTIPEAPKEEKRGNNRGRNMGKPGRKGK
ncbi:MAG: translation initiation factor IF-2 N-terminal domain-containing protein, partial [Lactobacillus crispatus]|nr:translation initiation factor IF-2 N-terminal domain-containing protein [Lactobacillus crispatus]